MSLDFDFFYGRSVQGEIGFATESFSIVILDFSNVGLPSTNCGGWNLNSMFKFICNDVKRGRRILLSRLPQEIYDLSDNHVRILTGGRGYCVFSPSQMEKLESEYNFWPDLKDYPNPFLYQPK